MYYVANMLDENKNRIPNRYRLMKSLVNDFDAEAFDLYSGTNWTVTLSLNGINLLLIENISAFEVRAYSESSDMLTDDYCSNDLSSSNTLPLWVDLYIETLSDEDAITAAALPRGTNRIDFLSKHANAYVTRVHFLNRAGYTRGR